MVARIFDRRIEISRHALGLGTNAGPTRTACATKTSDSIGGLMPVVHHIDGNLHNTMSSSWLHPSWLTIPIEFRVWFPRRRWHNLPCPEAPLLPEGWRWLNVGEWTEREDVMCDYRCKPVPISGIWLMTEHLHPTRRRIPDAELELAIVFGGKRKIHLEE